MNRRAILVYCVLVYIISWALQIEALHEAGSVEKILTVPWAPFVMFVPALTALVFVAVYAPSRAWLLWKPSWRLVWPLFVAVFIPVSIAFGVVATFVYLGWGQSGWFVFGHSGVTVTGGPWILGAGFQSWPVYIANVFSTGVCYAAFNGLFALGEEIGWRGFLQGLLIARLGATRGIVVLGFIWSFWHLPLLLAGYNYPQHPLLGAFVLFPVMLIGASFFLGWLTLKARSFWAAAIAHGAVNSIQQGVVSNIHLSVPQLYEDIIPVLFTVLVGVIFWFLIANLLKKAPTLRTN